VVILNFELDGEEFIALNGGPYFKFSPAVSFYISCEDQEEIDHYWEKLSAGGEIEMCGWLKDKYGVSWQVVPSILNELMQDKNPAKSRRVMDALLEMRKIEIAGLLQAFDQG
jgi:predicted 3-demethylubiquinone-9 3-methyltransferase (glyoxalase superfamily)